VHDHVVGVVNHPIPHRQPSIRTLRPSSC
jgi:hypothetical protein